MIAVLSLIRESGSMEHYPNVQVGMVDGGDITAICMEDVPEKRLTCRYGEPDIEFTGNLLRIDGEEYKDGNMITLTDAELEEAKKAIAENLAAYNAHKAALIEHLKPEDNL